MWQNKDLGGNKMKLDVPLYAQQTKDDCLIETTRMLLAYHCIEKTADEIKESMEKETEYSGVGSYLPQAGTYLQSLGFETEIVSMNPHLFVLKDKGISKHDVLSRFEKIKTYNKDNERNTKVIIYFSEYLNAGGKISPTIPSSKDIETEIENKSPVLVVTTTRFLFQDTPKFNTHALLITGYDDKNFYVNDPGPSPYAGKKELLKEHLMYGIYATAHGDFDNAAILKVKKKDA